MSIKQGNYLKELRTKNNLSQEKLAEKLGISRQSVSKWEQGYASPDTDNVLKLSKLYGVSVDSILNCTEEIEEEKMIQEEVSGNNVPQQDKTAACNHAEKEPAPTKKKRGWLFAAYPCIAVLVTVALGVFCHAWLTSWIFLLTIPLFYTTIIAVEKKNAVIFCYPVLMVMIYLLGGFYLHLWHPLWIIFLTIPIYYIATAVSRKNKRK